MQYVRMPIEIESPEQFGYEKIACNLAESSVTDALFQNLGIDIHKLVLCYGDHFGKPELRELIAAESKNLSADHILLTPGAASSLFIVATALLEKKDHIVVMRPNYATNIETPKAIGCEISYLDLLFEEGFRPDMQKLKNLIRKGTKLISITCPHNPTGTVLRTEELLEIIDIAKKSNCFLLVDETYRDLTFENKLPVAASIADHVISVSSVSKTYGLPGIRIGWLSTQNKKLMEIFLAAKEQIFICNSVVDEEIAYSYLLKKNNFLPDLFKHIRGNFNLLETWMEKQQILEWVKPAGGVVCFPRIKNKIGIDTEKFYRVLNSKYGTFVGPGHWFEMDKNYMRIGFGWPSAKELAKGIENIGAALHESCI